LQYKETAKRQYLNARLNTFITWFEILMLDGRAFYSLVPAQYTFCELVTLASEGHVYVNVYNVHSYIWYFTKFSVTKYGNEKQH
jgi:hypothetical protein